MLAGKIPMISMISKRWLLAFAVGLAFAAALSLTFVDDADAKLNSTEKFLASNQLWFEYDYDGDLVCYLYDVRRGTPSNPVAHLRVIKRGYPVNLFTGQCRLSTPLSPNFGGVGSVKRGVLKIQWPSGYVERISLGGYDRSNDALAIRRSSTGNSWWLGCRSVNHPYC